MFDYSLLGLHGMLGMGMDWTLGVASDSCLVVRTSVEIPAYESLQVQFVVGEIVWCPGLSVVSDGELPMTYGVAMGYTANVVVVVVGLVVAFPLVPLLLMKSLLVLVFSFPGWKYPYLCLDDRVFCYLQLCPVI